MASVHRHPKSKYYSAFFRDNEGKLRCKTTKQTDAKLAQEIANGWEKVFRTKNVLEHIRTTFDRQYVMPDENAMRDAAIAKATELRPTPKKGSGGGKRRQRMATRQPWSTSECSISTAWRASLRIAPKGWHGSGKPPRARMRKRSVCFARTRSAE